MIRNELTKIIQTNNGSRRRVKPGARNVRIVTIRLMDAADRTDAQDQAAPVIQ